MTDVVVLNEVLSKRFAATRDTLIRGEEVVKLSEQLLSDMVFLFSIFGPTLRHDGASALEQLYKNAAYTAICKKTSLLQSVRSPVSYCVVVATLAALAAPVAPALVAQCCLPLRLLFFRTCLRAVGALSISLM